MGDTTYNVEIYDRKRSKKLIRFLGAADRAVAVQIADLDTTTISAYLKNADLLETWITSLRELALSMLESGAKLPDYKLVAKRAIRQWTDEDKAKVALFALGLEESEVMETSIMSPATSDAFFIVNILEENSEA